jgi:hypothetical protein
MDGRWNGIEGMIEDGETIPAASTLETVMAERAHREAVVRPGTTGLKAAALESIGPLLRGRGSGSESLWSKVIPGQFSRLAVRAAYPHYLSYEKADESLRSADFFEGGC